MVKFYTEIPNNLRDWALQQPLFFVASAPWTGKHINLSPKGMTSATFTITNPNSASYIDTTGSGSETIAHIYENRRVVIMFCSFDTLPRIVRFWCWGSVMESDSPHFDAALASMGQSREALPGARAIINLSVFSVATSCGTGVPILAAQRPQSTEEEASNDASAGDGEKVLTTKARELLRDRPTLNNWAHKMSSSGKLKPYQSQNNAWSLDGCTGLRTARKSRGQALWLLDVAVWARRVLVGEWEAVLVGVLIGMALMVAARALDAVRT